MTANLDRIPEVSAFESVRMTDLEISLILRHSALLTANVILRMTILNDDSKRQRNR